jgi:acetyltransferase-like isoleucine patch superfamily enzyme
MIHPLSNVLSINIGKSTDIWQYAIVLKGAVIGENCNINCHTFIENDVKIGNNVTVKSGVFLWDGIEVEDNVFIGPNVTFTNDKYPRSKKYPDSFQKIKLKNNCSIGANATILGGSTIGSFSIIGAGSVVTKDVPAFAIMAGNPGRILGWVNENGEKLECIEGQYNDANGNKFRVVDNELIKI